MSKKLVLCVAREEIEKLFSGRIPTGFSVGRDCFHKVAMCFIEHGKFLSREIVENDETVLQAIVYGVVCDSEHILGLWRKERQVGSGDFKETRHNNLIGLAAGGHLEPSDNFGKESFFDEEIIREFSEELCFSEEPRPIPVGIIMYEETPLDRVHIGLIYKVMTQAEKVGLTDNNDEYDYCRFLLPAELPPLREQMEGWGKVITDAIISGSFKLGEK